MRGRALASVGRAKTVVATSNVASMPLYIILEGAIEDCGDIERAAVLLHIRRLAVTANSSRAGNKCRQSEAVLK